MFYIREHGRGSWKVAPFPTDPRHTDFKFARAYPTREAAELEMLVGCYEWPQDLAEFAVGIGCLVYDEAKRLFEESKQAG